jgi:glucose-6-phosphate-specific signal transduction histidine kinase
MAAVHPPQHEDAVVDGSAVLYRLIAETIPLMVWTAERCLANWSRARRGGWGLPEMRECAQAHGGSLRIEVPGRGTRVIVELPGTHAD